MDNIKDTFTLIKDTKLGGNNITIICVQGYITFSVDCPHLDRGVRLQLGSVAAGAGARGE